MTKKQLQETIDILLRDRQEILSSIAAMIYEQKKALIGQEQGELEIMDPTDILNTDIAYLTSVLDRFGYKPEGFEIH